MKWELLGFPVHQREGGIQPLAVLERFCALVEKVVFVVRGSGRSRPERLAEKRRGKVQVSAVAAFRKARMTGMRGAWLTRPVASQPRDPRR